MKKTKLILEKKRLIMAVMASLGMFIAPCVYAQVVFTGGGAGNDTTPRSASVTFAIVGGNLQVTLANTGSAPATGYDATYALGAVFFNYTGPGTLSANNSMTAAVPGTGVIGQLASSSDTIGSYWAFDSGLSGTPENATDGLRGVGLGVNGGSPDANMGPNPEQHVDGIAGSILGWNMPPNGNSSLTEPLAYDSITFTLIGSDLPSTLSASDFSDVNFVFGTTLDGADTFTGAPVPEPTTLVAGAMLLLPFGLSTCRIFRKSCMAKA